MNNVFLITGGNMGDRKSNLEEAAALIEENIGTITKRSSIYETEAWGNKDQPSFYNQVLIVESKFSAHDIMSKILEIEKEMGRIRTVKNAARIIDIDILFYNNEIIEDSLLTVPHKEIQNRSFVLMPLNEVAANYVHPVLKTSIKQLLSQCTDPLKVIRLKEL
jgi:2-amino-4-hydroxy-6-hydroxymethyldihydropteridine diphosphokinase